MYGTFVCSTCKGEFDKGPPGEAEQEAAENGFSLDDSCLVCDACYHTIMQHNFGSKYANYDPDGAKDSVIQLKGSL